MHLSMHFIPIGIGEYMYSTVRTAVLDGINAIPVQVEVDISTGMPVFDMVGNLTPEAKGSKGTGENSTSQLRDCSSGKENYSQSLTGKYKKSRYRF